MAKPKTLTRLEVGKALGAYPDFVDSWNYVADFIEHLRGEGEDDPTKSLVLDRTDVTHPVIRSNGRKYVLTATARTHATFASAYDRQANTTTILMDIDTGGMIFPGCFHVADDGTLVNRYYSRGGVIMEAPERSIESSDAGKFLCLQLGAAPIPEAAHFVTFETAAAMLEASRDENHYLLPLYHISAAGKVDVDLRAMPVAAMMEA